MYIIKSICTHKQNNTQDMPLNIYKCMKDPMTTKEG